MLNYEIDNHSASLHVAALARRTDVTPATIRYYARIGLLSPGREPENGYRCFSSADVHRVQFIRQAQALGLTIGDLKAIFETVEHGETPCDQVTSLVEKRLVSIQSQIAELHGIESRVVNALAVWQKSKRMKPKRGEICPLIERLVTIDGNDCARGIARLRA